MVAVVMNVFKHVSMFIHKYIKRNSKVNSGE